MSITHAIWSIPIRFGVVLFIANDLINFYIHDSIVARWCQATWFCMSFIVQIKFQFAAQNNFRYASNHSKMIFPFGVEGYVRHSTCVWVCVREIERERLERLSNASINLVLRMRMCGCKKYKCIFDDNIPTYSTVSAFNFRSSPGEVFFIDLPPSTSSVPSCESLWNGWKTCKCHIEKFEICTCWFEVCAVKSCSNWHVSGSFNVTLTLESDATDHRSLVSNCTAGLSRPIPNQIVGVENWIGNWMHFRIKL